jgi:hypothetical protein
MTALSRGSEPAIDFEFGLLTLEILEVLLERLKVNSPA